MRQLKITKSITNRDAVSLDKYLQEIGKVDLITIMQEVELAQRIKQGDQQALDKLVKANLRFVVSVAKQYQNQWVSLPDLINEGNIGLIKAAKRFDETRWFKFISYAVRWIRQSILQALAETGKTIRLPLNKIGNMNKINKAKSMLEQEYEREPTTKEIMHALEFTEDQIEFYDNIQKVVSLDAPIGEDTMTIEDTISNDTPPTDHWLITEWLKHEIMSALRILHPREREIIKYYFGLDGYPLLTLEEIGDKFGLTRERTRQIKEKGIRRLKYKSSTKNLKPYL